MGTLLFIAHPVHTEVVANIKSRDEILAFLFLVLALSFWGNYARKPQAKTLLLALLAYTGALFSKESAVTFLAIFPLTFYFFERQKLTKAIKYSLPFFIPTLFFLTVRFAVIGTLGNNAPPDQ